MTTTSTAPGVQRRPAADHVGWIAALWAASYGVVHLVWVVTGSGFPFGTNLGDPASPLRALTPGVGAPVFAGVLLVTAVVLVTMAGPAAVRLRGTTRAAAAAWCGLVATGFVVLVPTMSVLAVLGYAPALIIGAPFGWPEQIDYGRIFNWAIANQVWSLAGGALVGAATVTFVRRARGACASCGCAPGESPAHRLDRAARWAVGVSVAVPLVYAVTRFAWLLGIPLALSGEELRELRAGGGQWAGAALGACAVVGAMLSVGLVARWGEVFPRWIPVLRGRRVPVPLAVVPATIVALALLSAGVGILVSDMGLTALRERDWFILPMALWPVWGVALGFATSAYATRRRDTCHSSGRTA
ncbi:hypothetical protein Drose_11105 [Dactylosporangium roseum]|uniref:Integral membrane protein n=1 Tax=Dactylosporangium roseum TaxID=47989 RepID=A0ABY5ZA29_9ACTN|nr:hypothetical protein [Dactylosporangium roseum]UWZ38717.1 hypothetical protein Drose_11105 [Dactylosporangium roseum]